VTAPTIGVDAPVVPVGLDEARAVEIPADIATVGWYSLGVAPGSQVGSAVLVGHRDGRVDGRGALYHLAGLAPGDRIEITDAMARQLVFTVVAREVVAKAVLPTDDLFAIDGPPRLTLITCGGEYVRDEGGYQANVIITAVPVTS
jgi:sortase (surface protein transpeptidase)